MSVQSCTNSSLQGLRVLVVDDEPDIRNGLGKLVSTLGAQVAIAGDGMEALEVLERDTCDLILTDLMMPRMTGSELLLASKERYPGIPVVVLTGYGTIQSAVTCLQNGAAHFMTKPFDNQEVLNLVGRLGRQVLAQRRPLGRIEEFPDIVAEDPRMKQVLQLVERVAASPVPVLVEGESGTGKEVIAGAIHSHSSARDKSFLAINAAALSDSLLESELFGHTKGAFTGAERAHQGLFEQAKGGTVFLDELCSMSKSFQGKLLRVLEEKEVRPVGADKNIPVDFRLVCATNRDLESLMRAGEFREDLFYRVSVMRVSIPPLRNRQADIVPLALRFLSSAAETCLGTEAVVPELGESAIDSLLRHPWPGNVRELQNCMYRALITCPGDRVQSHHLGIQSGTWKGPDNGEASDYAESKKEALEHFQREFVQRALENSQGNITQAAQSCGMTRAALQRILRQLDIDPNRFR